jgi:hypothetical protein
LVDGEGDDLLLRNPIYGSTSGETKASAAVAVRVGPRNHELACFHNHVAEHDQRFR